MMSAIPPKADIAERDWYVRFYAKSRHQLKSFHVAAQPSGKANVSCPELPEMHGRAGCRCSAQTKN